MSDVWPYTFPTKYFGLWPNTSAFVRSLDENAQYQKLSVLLTLKFFRKVSRKPASTALGLSLTTVISSRLSEVVKTSIWYERDSKKGKKGNVSIYQDISMHHIFAHCTEQPQKRYSRTSSKMDGTFFWNYNLGGTLGGPQEHSYDKYLGPWPLMILKITHQDFYTEGSNFIWTY